MGADGGHRAIRLSINIRFFPPSLILLLTARPFITPISTTTSISTTIPSDLILFVNMRFSLPLLSVLLMAATALAAPQGFKLPKAVCNLVFQPVYYT